MEVTKVYMDLKEATPQINWWRNVWVLESEAFKDPITLQLEYSDKDKAYIEESKELVEEKVKEANDILVKIENKIVEYTDILNRYREEIENKDSQIKELQEKVEKSEKEKIKLLQDNEWTKRTVIALNEQLSHQAKQINELSQKATKQTTVYSWQTFVSWIWNSALADIQTYDWDYCVIRTTKIVEKNEFVSNEDVEVGAVNIHVQDWLFIPEFELKSESQMDTPTATVDRTFTLIPC